MNKLKGFIIVNGSLFILSVIFNDYLTENIVFISRWIIPVILLTLLYISVIIYIVKYTTKGERFFKISFTTTLLCIALYWGIICISFPRNTPRCAQAISCEEHPDGYLKCNYCANDDCTKFGTVKCPAPED